MQLPDPLESKRAFSAAIGGPDPSGAQLDEFAQLSPFQLAATSDTQYRA